MKAVETILERAQSEGRTSLLEHEVYQILQVAGITVPRWHLWEGPPAAEPPKDVRDFLAGLPGHDVVLKIVSPQILHKSDLGGLAFCSREPGVVAPRARAIWGEVSSRAPSAELKGILLTEKVPTLPAGIASELLVSMKQDPAFGPVLVLGLGGVLTEWFGEFSHGTSTIILQPGRVRAGLEQFLPSLPVLRFLFQPSRLHRTPPLSLDAVAEALEGLGRVAQAFAGGSVDSRFTLEELEMNPMLLAAGGGWVAVDGVGRFSQRKSRRVERPLEKITRLLRPRSAVVIGASAKGMNPGRIILRNLKLAEGVGYGRIYAVHPKEKTIDGIPCVPNLEALPEPCDLAIVSIPAEGARDAIRTLSEKGLASSIILIPGGFAETGRRELEGQIIESLTASRARQDRGPVLVGGNSLGVVSKDNYNTFFLPLYKLPFHQAPGDHLAAISQSGAYLVALTSNLDGVVFPKVSISYGNQMDLTASDFLEYFLDDEEVRVLAFYIEGFKPLDGERFLDLAREAKRRGKQVIAFKAGKTALGAKAAQSHTASLAGDYAVARQLMIQAGVNVAETLDMFEDYIKVYTMLWDRRENGETGGNRVGVISNAGFECGAVLDKLYDLRLATLAPATLEKLRGCLPDIAHADNPVDATPMATTRQFIEATQAMLEDPDVDALLVSPVPVTSALDDLPPDLLGTHPENIFSSESLPQELLRLFRESRKPIVVSVDSGRLYDDMVMMLQRGGIPVYRKIDRASRALSALCAQ